MSWKPPGIKDPRYLQLLFLLLYVVYALSSESFTRTPTQFFATLTTCVVADVLLVFWFKRLKLFPLSGLITVMGSFLLSNSPFVWPYFLVAMLSIASKHFITVDGRHVFNPNNFGLVICLLFLGDYLTVEAATWGGHQLLVVSIFCLGSYVVYRAERLTLTISFLLTFLTLCFVRAAKSGLSPETLLIPVTGPAFHLFIFHMITDPRTTPHRVPYQIWFGVVLGILDAIFRVFEEKYSIFYSLFIMSAVFSAFPHLFKNLKTENR